MAKFFFLLFLFVTTVLSLAHPDDQKAQNQNGKKSDDNNRMGKNVCEKWCEEKFHGKEEHDCKSAAQRGQGPCFVWGPMKPNHGNKQRCGNDWVDVKTDNNNCGKCNNKCPEGSYCSDGQCKCRNYKTLCGWDNWKKCVDTKTDDKNCGRCDNKCPEGSYCSDGQCKCRNNKTLCGRDHWKKCVDTKTDEKNCGYCGKECKDGKTCYNGECKLICRDGKKECCNKCVDQQKDPKNCGACGTVCLSGNCQWGKCVGYFHCPRY